MVNLEHRIMYSVTPCDLSCVSELLSSNSNRSFLDEV